MPVLELMVDAGTPFNVQRFAVSESLSTPFLVTCIADAGDNTLDLDTIVDHPATFRINPTDRSAVTTPRAWTGVCMQAALIDPLLGNGAGSYLVKVVSRFWLLTMRRENRIFQHKSIPEIVEGLLGEWKVQPVLRLTKSYKALEYCVQYGETDYAFVNRLLEKAGITYLFEGGDMVLSDQPHLADPRSPAFPFHDNPTYDLTKDWMSDVHVGRRVKPGKTTVRDYEFRRQTKAQFFGVSHTVEGPEARYEQYHYLHGVSLVEPGAPVGESTPVADANGVARHDQSELTAYAERGLGSDRLSDRPISFRTSAMDVAPGKIFTIKNHPHHEVGKDQRLLVTHLSLEGTSTGFDWVFHGEAVHAGPDAPYQPAQKTPKPRITGVQSAIVVGKAGEEVHTDEFGRVRVQFHWDRDHSRDEHSSCWIRVSQGWAGAGYGTILIPRVGHEVLVAFFDGDPDMPIIVGRAYNGKNSVPYKLPENQTTSTWKSDSSPGDNGYNEILYEDAAKEEYIYVQAQRDLQRLVKHSESERTGKHRQMYIGQDHRAIVAKLEATFVGKKYQVQIMEEPSEAQMAILPQTKPSLKPLPTKIEMMDKKLMTTSGKATMLMKKDRITFDVKGNIYIKSKGGDVVFETPSNVIKINC